MPENIIKIKKENAVAGTFDIRNTVRLLVGFP
jgi:hypothetical protein